MPQSKKLPSKTMAQWYGAGLLMTRFVVRIQAGAKWKNCRKISKSILFVYLPFLAASRMFFMFREQRSRIFYVDI